MSHWAGQRAPSPSERPGPALPFQPSRLLLNMLDREETPHPSFSLPLLPVRRRRAKAPPPPGQPERRGNPPASSATKEESGAKRMATHLWKAVGRRWGWSCEGSSRGERGDVRGYHTSVESTILKGFSQGNPVEEVHKGPRISALLKLYHVSFKRSYYGSRTNLSSSADQQRQWWGVG